MVSRVKALPSRTTSRPELVAALAAALLLACGGNEFSSEAGGSGGSGPSAGSPGRGGATGSSGEGGTTAGGSTSQGGNTGKGGGTSGCNCNADQYCRNGNCRDCNDFSLLNFDPPEALGTIADSGAARPSFPRSAGDNALFYSSDHPQGHIYFTADFSAGGGQRVSGAAAPPEFGPLYIEDSGGLDFDFLFTRVSQDGLGSDIMMASWDETAHTLSGIMPVATPVNGDSSIESQVAFAAGTLRYWWMSDRAGPPALYTALLSDPQEQPVTLQIPGMVNSTCVAMHPDLTPWVTSDGSLMLFSAEAIVDGQCGVDGTTDLYAVPVSSAGEPVTPSASALNDLNLPANETTPSLSADSCWIYFASDEGSGSQSFTIFRAHRR